MNIWTEPQSALNQWLKGNGVDLSNVELRGQGDKRGLETKTFIAKNQVILHIPISAVLHSQLAQASVIGENISGKIKAPISDQSYLAAYILSERSTLDSPWRCYLNTLPFKFKHIPTFFDEEQLNQLQGSPVLERSLERWANLRHDYEVLREATSQFDDYTLEEFMWARTAISSRSFSFRQGIHKLVAMVPLLDMCNHDHSPNAGWQGDESGFTLRALKSIHASQELFISYGDKSNNRFYNGYGFVPKDGYGDTARINIHLDTASPHYGLHKKLLNGQSQFEFEVTADWCDQIKSLFKVLRVMQLIGELDSDIEKINQYQATGVTSEQKVIQNLKILVQQSIGLYPVVTEENIALADTLPSTLLEDSMFDTAAYNNRLIVLREKRVLNCVMAFCDEALKFLAQPVKGNVLIAPHTRLAMFQAYWRDSLDRSLILDGGVSVKRQKACAVTSHQKADPSKISLTQVTPSVWASLHSITLHADDRSAVPTTHTLLKDVTFSSSLSEGHASPVHVAAIWNDNETVGVFTYLWQTERSVWFGGFQVDQKRQGEGLGKHAFLIFLSGLLNQGNFKDIQLDVVRNNYKVLRFYQRMGFIPILLNTQTPNRWVLKLTRSRAEKLLSSEGYSLSE